MGRVINIPDIVHLYIGLVCRITRHDVHCFVDPALLNVGFQS